MARRLDKTKRYTYADYRTWEDGVRRELINGTIHVQQPDGTYSETVYEFQVPEVPVHIFPDLKIKWADLFED